MKVFLQLSVVLLLLGLGHVSGASAQQCEAAYETITALRKPIVGSYNHWDAVYGEMDSIEGFVGGVLNANKNVVAAGELRAYAGADPDLILVEFDRRGRVVWEAVHKIKALEKVKKIMILDDGYLIIAQQKNGRKGGEVFLGFYDQKGGLRRKQVVADDKYDLSFGDLIKAQDGDGYVLAVFAKGRAMNSTGQTSIYKLDKRGRVVSSKTYLPGIESRPSNITTLSKERYLVSGYIRTEDGRKAGWLMVIENDGRVAWQRPYARGLFAKITKAQSFIQNYIITIGDAEPSNRKNRAVWVMLINEETGDIGWQRYYKGDFDFYGRDVIAHSDGQISLLIDARNPPKQDKEEYARVLTLSPRGVILLSNSYYNGKGGHALDMLLGPNQERILVGSSDIAHLTENEANPEDIMIEISPEAWVVAGSPVEPYDDPCVQSYSFLP